MLNRIAALDRSLNGKLNKFSTSHFVNQTLKWLPAVTLLVYNPGKGKSIELMHRIKLLALSEFFAITVMKASTYLLPRNRPTPWMDHDSFPSGHTAQAFLGAEIVHQRFQQKSPGLAMAAYGVATCMAASRLLAKKHWLSDVIAGAALGIVAAKLASQLLQTKPSSFRKMVRQIKLIRSGQTMNLTLPR